MVALGGLSGASMVVWCYMVALKGGRLLQTCYMVAVPGLLCKAMRSGYPYAALCLVAWMPEGATEIPYL